jgi:hypothetical protein
VFTITPARVPATLTLLPTLVGQSCRFAPLYSLF